MNTYLKPFELTLRCLGPVFIGSGEKRTSKEYHVEGDRVYFPDMELLYADIPAHKRKSFEAFVMNTDGAQATAPLKEWVEPNAVKLDPAKHRGYEVKIGSIEPRRAWSRRAHDSKEAYAQRDSRFHQRPSWKALRAGFDCQGNASQHLPAVACA